MTISESNEPLTTGIKAILVARGIKQIYLARRTGFSAQEISDMLNGRRVIRACDIPRLVKGLDTTYKEVFETGEENE